MLDWGAGDAGDEGEAEEAGGGRGGTELHCLSISMQREVGEAHWGTAGERLRACSTGLHPVNFASFTTGMTDPHLP